ncbi:MAG: hypothetical protein EOM20_03360 [Spartobacteria bacterium]|nr:hypothetical protein [Spartobacteria bacterium]
MSTKVATSTNKYGHWTGTGASDPLTDLEQSGYGLGTRTRWYQFVQHVATPLTYQHPNGCWYQPLNGLFHNFGSIPRLAQVIPGFEKDRHADEYTLHDQCYSSQYPAHTVLVSRDCGQTWRREKVTRPFADRMLYLSILADEEITPALLWRARAIYASVAIGGWRSWKNKEM